MKLTKMTIASGMVAMALVACSDNESTGVAPDPVKDSSGETTLPQDTILEPPDIPEGPSEDENRAYAEVLTEAHSIDNQVQIEPSLNASPIVRYKLKKGEAWSVWIGSADKIVCEENDTETFVYKVSVTNKRFNLDESDRYAHKDIYFNDKDFLEVFAKDCIAEGGTIVTDEDNHKTCAVLVPTAMLDNVDFISYTDPSWTKYSTAVLNYCHDLTYNE